MRFLLDTHVTLAVLGKKAHMLPPFVQLALASDGSELHASVASLWEIAIKWRLGKLPLMVALEDLPTVLESMAVRIFAIEARHVLAYADPEPQTRDPFDRLLLAQCKVEGMRLLTTDRALVAHSLAAKA